MENKIEKLADIIKNSKHLVFFTGAGVSTESGLKSFRGKDGLYSSLYKGKYRPEEVLSSDFFLFTQKNIYRICWRDWISMVLNLTSHLALAELERRGTIKSSDNSKYRWFNIKWLGIKSFRTTWKFKKMVLFKLWKTSNKNFSCDCGGIVRPDVTLYGENLNQDVVNEAIYQIEQADTLIVAGTSLTVYPAAYYLRYFRGKNLVIINNESTQYDGEASLVLKTNFADTMEKVLNIIKK